MFTSFEEMPVWKLAMEIAEDVFALTESLPRKEDDGLTSQLRRSAVSISANIAEGFGRMHSKDKTKFYCQSRGSTTETKSNLLYGCRVGYFDDASIQTLLLKIEDVWKQLNCLITTMHSSSHP